MEPALQWGLEFIRNIQGFSSPLLTVVMRIITAFGGAAVCLILPPFIYWCVDDKKGLRLETVVLISLWINIFLKITLNQPRPFFEGYDPSLGIVNERMGGLPSGHAQNALVLFFILASWINKRWAYIFAAVLCFLTGFSRIYLGVHFPTDVAAGWILGGVILCGYFLLGGMIETFFIKGGLRASMITGAVVSFLMIFYLPGEELLVPAGFLLGMCAGYCLNKRYIGFKSAALCERTGMMKFLILFARFLLGIAGFVLVYFIVGKIIPQNSANHNLFRFIHFALGGIWIFAAAPWVFIKLRLAEAELKE